MQPYLFPYPGYFQLIHAVDAFVVYDDVNYITRGWINRNHILERGQARRITLEVSGASQNRRINEIGVGGNRNKLLRQLHHAYARAPQFDAVFPLLEAVLMHDEPNLARFLANGLQRVCEYLDLQRAWHVSSDIIIDDTLRGTGSGGSPEATVMNRVPDAEIQQAMASLPEEYRSVVLMALLEEMSYKEIAAALAIPLGTVMSRLHRGRKLLQAALLEYARRKGILRSAPEVSTDDA